MTPSGRCAARAVDSGGSGAATESKHPEIDWGLGTFEGARREQLRRWCALTFREKLLVVEEMAEVSERLRQVREHEGRDFYRGEALDGMPLASCDRGHTAAPRECLEVIDCYR
ncbi:MAG: hypothetical protein ACRENI_08445 [Gemmatimonadaceae bacterium]